MTKDTRQDLTTHAARRRRALAGVLATAALGLPGTAAAAADDAGSTGADAPQPPSGEIVDERGSGGM